MYTNRRAILSLVAVGRITPVEAERLIAACSSDRVAWWMLTGCALCAGVMQIHPHLLAAMAHLLSPVIGLKAAIEGRVPEIHHVTTQIARFFGGDL
jgi:hypothetical protein